MNALARAAARTVPRTPMNANVAIRRTLTTWPEFKKNWLSDPGAYPIIVILTVTCIGCATKCTHYLATHPDARITPSKRTAPLRTW